MKTDAKQVLLTTVAALSLTAGGALAGTTTTATADTDQAEAGVMANAETNTLLNDSYNEIGDRQVAELIGMNVLSDTGEDVGEIDNFVILDNELKAVVGVGGFLGLGEHDVAISLNDMEYTGDALQLSFTREELEQMPQYTEELHQERLAETDTLNTYNGSTGGMMNNADTASMDTDMSEEAETEGTDMAATGGELAEDLDADDTDMANADIETETEAETDMASTEEAVESEVEQEATELANEADAVAEETEQMAENAAAETENAVEDAGETMANAAAETENAVEGATEDAGQELAEAGDATENALEDAGQEVADAGEATENAIEGAAASAGAALADAGNATENAIEDAGQEIASWDEKLESEFSDIANTEIAELRGTTVVGPNGETVGEVDNIGMLDDAMVAIVGVGGFLGLGEHDVAIELANLGWKDGQFVAEGMTKEDLEAMPEYDREELVELEADATLSNRMN